jgi:PIN domain nuclease of toxin-antitoxin system
VASAFVLDTSALLAYLYGEPGHEVVQLLSHARTGIIDAWGPNSRGDSRPARR